VILMLTNVYVDGFNLYYGRLKDTPYKWLDLGALCQALLPPNKIQRICYFTAKISAQADPHQPVRQSRRAQGRARPWVWLDGALRGRRWPVWPGARGRLRR
jgi:hypothetical protein